MKKIYIIVLVFITCFCFSCENNQVQNDLIIDGVQYIKGPSNCLSLSSKGVKWNGDMIDLYHNSYIKFKAVNSGTLLAVIDGDFTGGSFFVEINGVEVYRYSALDQETMQINSITEGDVIKCKYIISGDYGSTNETSSIRLSNLRIQLDNTINNNPEQNNPSFDF